MTVDSGEKSMAGRPTWGFVSNHGAVLLMLHKEGEITARLVASRLGITERTVRRILSDLEAEGYILRERIGRSNRYRVDVNKPLRRSDQRGVSIGELLEIMRLPDDN
jgi:DNA-binding transcriptional ArsR family regulator